MLGQLATVLRYSDISARFMNVAKKLCLPEHSCVKNLTYLEVGTLLANQIYGFNPLETHLFIQLTPTDWQRFILSTIVFDDKRERRSNDAEFQTTITNKPN